MRAPCTGVIVRSYATAAEEDNDGGGPRHVVAKIWPGAGADMIPDVVILTEGTGDAIKGALGIYRGQRGRMQIEVTVVGRSCHGSMPFEGLNPLEHGGAILAEAARRHAAGDGFARPLVPRSRHPHGVVVDARHPQRLRGTGPLHVPLRSTPHASGETPEQSLADVESLGAVAAARAAGLTVTIDVPRYTQPTWRGYPVDNAQIYPGWVTPAEHPAIRAAVDAYRRVVTPHVAEPAGGATGGALRARTSCRQVDLLDRRRRLPDPR